MAKKKNKKKKDNKAKSKKKKILKKKDSKKKILKKKKAEKKALNKKKKSAPKKEKSLKTKLPKQVSPAPVAKVSSDHSSNYNVRDAVVKLRAMQNPDHVRVFTKGETRLTIIKALSPVISRLEK